MNHLTVDSSPRSDVALQESVRMRPLYKLILKGMLVSWGSVSDPCCLGNVALVCTSGDEGAVNVVLCSYLIVVQC